MNYKVKPRCKSNHIRDKVQPNTILNHTRDKIQPIQLNKRQRLIGNKSGIYANNAT